MPFKQLGGRGEGAYILSEETTLAPLFRLLSEKGLLKRKEFASKKRKELAPLGNNFVPFRVE